MNRTISGLIAAALFFFTSASCFADLQYTEQSKITGGAMVGAMKFVGVFSKDAKQATQGTTATISVKGNKLRRENSLGTAEIYDLDGRRVINVDLKHKTYSVTTFDELKAQLEEARRKAAEQQAKSQKSQDTQVKITPKIQMTPGTGSKQLLNYTAKEMKTRVDMQMESTDPKHKGETGNMWVNSDAYIAPVKGADELKRFYQKMAKELDWVPGAAFGGNVQISQPMVEYRKSLTNLNGMPLLSYVSVGMGPNQGTTGQAAASQPTPEKKEGNAISKGLGGMFGGLGKKKNKDNTDQNNTGNSGSSSTASSSLMDMTTEVTSISNNPVDASSFEIPQGFKQVEARKSGEPR